MFISDEATVALLFALAVLYASLTYIQGLL